MAGVEGSGSRICKAAGSGRYRGKFCNILQSKKRRKVVSNKNRAGTEIGSGKVKPNSYMQRSSCSCIHFSFLAPEEGLFCKPKYRANILLNFISASILISQSFN